MTKVDIGLTKLNHAYKMGLTDSEDRHEEYKGFERYSYEQGRKQRATNKEAEQND